MEKEENTVTITATPNGPFIVEGNFKLVDREGKARDAGRPDSPLPLRTLLQTTFLRRHAPQNPL